MSWSYWATSEEHALSDLPCCLGCSRHAASLGNLCGTWTGRRITTPSPRRGELLGKKDNGAPAAFPWSVKKGNFLIKIVIRWKLLVWASISLIQQGHFHLGFVAIKGSQSEFSHWRKGEPPCSITNTCSSWWRVEYWICPSQGKDPKHWPKLLAQNKVTSAIPASDLCSLHWKARWRHLVSEQNQHRLGPFLLRIWPSNCVSNSLFWAREEERLFLTLSQLLFSVTLV